MVRRSRIGLVASAAFLLAFSGVAEAGPPFTTDDPEPTEYGTFENYLFSTAIRADHQTVGSAVGVELNYGAFPDTQLTANVSLDYAPGPNGGTITGSGPIELSAKYRFIEEDEDGWRPQVAFFPQINLPVDRNLGTTNTSEYFPVWAQKSFGQWTTFGGGGYWINPGPGNRNYWFAGWAVLRQITPNLHLGGEIFHQSASIEHTLSQTSFNGALLFDFSDHWHIVGSAGRGLVHATETNQFSYYLALEWTT